MSATKAKKGAPAVSAPAGPSRSWDAVEWVADDALEAAATGAAAFAGQGGAGSQLTLSPLHMTAASLLPGDDCVLVRVPAPSMQQQPVWVGRVWPPVKKADAVAARLPAVRPCDLQAAAAVSDGGTFAVARVIARTSAGGIIAAAAGSLAELSDAGAGKALATSTPSRGKASAPGTPVVAGKAAAAAATPTAAKTPGAGRPAPSPQMDPAVAAALLKGIRPGTPSAGAAAALSPRGGVRPASSGGVRSPLPDIDTASAAGDVMLAGTDAAGAVPTSGWNLLPAQWVRATVIDGPRAHDDDAVADGTTAGAPAAGAASVHGVATDDAVDGLADDLSKLLLVSGTPAVVAGGAPSIDVRQLSPAAMEVATKAMFKAVASSGLTAASSDAGVSPVIASGAPPAGCYVLRADGRTVDDSTSGDGVPGLAYEAFPHALVRFLTAAAAAPACGLLRGLCIPTAAAGAATPDSTLPCDDAAPCGIIISVGGFQVNLAVVDPAPATDASPAAAAGAASAPSALAAFAAGSSTGSPATHCFIAPTTAFEVVWPKVTGCGTPTASSCPPAAAAARPDTPASTDAPTSDLGDGFGGYEAEVALLQRLLASALLQPHVHTDAGLRPPRGALLTGPPGTGKTMLARTIAARLKVAFIVVNGPEVLSPVVGESEARLRKVFAAAAAAAPCIVFIDEIDGLAPRRDGAVGGSGAAPVSEVEVRIVATLLSLLDGAGATVGARSSGSAGSTPASPSWDRVFVLGATNRPSAIDTALRRPGRFDREIAIGVPSQAQRESILRACLARYASGSAVATASTPAASVIGDGSATVLQPVLAVTADGLRTVVERSHGYVGADLAAVCREAALTALRRYAATDVSAAGGSAALALTDADLASGLSSVQPSAIREIAVEVPSVRWIDIGGQEDVKQRLREAVEWPLSHPEAFARLGIRPPRGVLLFGPPGCSKTMMAKAMATESHMNFIAVKGPELFSKYVGDSEKAVAEVFHKARTASPCIIFFDEFDAMAGTRGGDDAGGGGSSVGTRVVSQLLTELDGVSALKQVVVVAATNRPDLIDRALLRPGRVDRLLYVGPPDAPAREAILVAQLKKVPHEAGIDIPALVAATDGYSGAEIVALFRDASVRAVMANLQAPRMSQAHLEAAVAATPRRITPEMLRFYSRFMGR